MVPDPDRSIMEPQVAAKIQEYREAVFADPDSHEAWGRLGMVLHAHALRKEASECYRRATALEPGEFRWQYLLAHAMEDPQEALAQAELAGQIKPDYSGTYVLRGQILEEDNELDQAVEQYIKAVAIDPQCAPAEFGLGRIYLFTRELEASLPHLLRAQELSPDAGAIRASLAQVYRRLGDREAAMREARLASELSGRIAITDPLHFEMTREDVSSLALLAQAQAAVKAADDEKAETLYRKLLEIRPDDADMHARLADTLARQDKHQDAKGGYLAALRINSRDASALFGLGRMLSSEKEYEEAARRYEESLEIRPNHVATHLDLGSILEFQGRLEEATHHYRQGLEIDPNHFGCNRQLGRLLLQQRKLPEAISHLRAALESRPEPGALHLQMAVALAGTGDYQNAWVHVKEAERLGANIPPKFLEALRHASPEPGGKRP